MFCATCCNSGGETEIVAVESVASLSVFKTDVEDGDLQSPRIAAAVDDQDDSDAESPRPIEVPAPTPIHDAPKTWGGKRAASWAFMATISRDGKKLGLDVNNHDGETLLITRVNPGPCDDYNKANAGSEIAPGDRITSVNGVVRDAAQMLEACKVSSNLSMVVRRCEELTVKLFKSKPEEFLGLGYEVCDTTTLVITGVDKETANSLAAEHNRLAPEYRIEKDFRIIGANGVRNNSAKVAEILRSSSSWELILREVWPR